MSELQEMPRLQEGLCVTPRSGGPVMVVFSIEGSSAYCRWLDGRELGGATFPLTELKSAPRERFLQALQGVE
jgi:uncharacterized protein YodC (DUF2158 family)